jgi:hypothetical protein
MSYGVKSYGDDGYINMHSDYSSMVYVGEMSQSVAPVRFIYTGDYSHQPTATALNTKYDLGYVMQFSYNLSFSTVLPFYMPNFMGQEISILDVVKETGVWKVNVLFSGTSTQKPRLFLFAPLTEFSSVTQNDYGLTVYDSSGNIVFTDAVRPLRVDDVVLISPPSSIRNGSKGSCGNDSGCDITYTPDQSATTTGATTNTSTKIYHHVPSAYGGMAYQNDGTYSRSCGFLNLGTRKYAWGYQSWASFRGTLKHPANTANHVATWQGDFCGKIHRVVSGSCGVGGFLGALIGIVLAPFTGGLSLSLVLVGAAVGFVVGSALAPSTPGLRAYTTDEVKDVSNPSNLIITDAAYYGITGEAIGGGGSAGFSGDYQYTGFVQPFTWWATTPFGYSVYWEGTVQASTIVSNSSSVTSTTGYDGLTYYRAPDWQDYLDLSALGAGEGIYYYYPVGRS